MHVLHRDIETRSTLDLTEVGVWRYAGDSTTDVWCVAYTVDADPVQIWIPGKPIPEEFHVAACKPDWLVVAHNDAFERTIEEQLLAPRYSWPLIPIERHRCTMAMALASAMPAALDSVAEVLELSARKDDQGARLMRQMARPRKPRADEPAGIYWHDDSEKLERLYAYCRRDVEVERELFHRLPPLIDSEQALWILDATINQRGFYTDGDLLEAASQIAAAAGEAVQEELRQITGGALTSTDQVAALLAWLAEHGCELKNLQKGTLKHALRRKELDPIAHRVVELRLGAAHAAAAKIGSLLAWRNTDGRVRGTLRYHGAATGRWTGHGPQPQNFKRDSDGVDAKIAAIMDGGKGLASPLEAVGDIARATICAAPGHRLLIGDFSGIESRVLAWVSGQTSKTEQWSKFDRTGDPGDEPYYLLGRSCGQSEESARKIGKVADLAFGYCGGPGAWDRLAPEDDTSSEEDKRRYQQTWRSLHPQTVQFWNGIDRTAIAAIHKPNSTLTFKRFSLTFDGTFLRTVLPSGRALAYPFPRLETGKFGNPMVVFKDNTGGKFVDCRFGQGAYGGLWTENIVQAVSRDLLAAAMIRLEAAGYPVVLHVHDEIVCEAPTKFGSLEEFQRLITTLPDWAADLPIAAKVRNGERFSKSEKPAASVDQKPQRLTAAEIKEINRRLKEEGIEPMHLDDGVEAKNGAETANGSSGNTNATNGAGANTSGQGQASASSTKSDYQDGADKDESKPYGPIRAALLAKGYRVARTFLFTVPGATEPLFYEDRYELRLGIAPAKQRPKKTSRYRHLVGGVEFNGTGPRRIIFNWPAIMQAGPGATVFITEGANKSEPLNATGLLATAAPYHQWGEECVSALAGAHLFYLADHNPPNGNDPALKFAADARSKLAPRAASFRVVPAAHLWTHLPPGTRPIEQGDDVKNWIELKGDLTKLEEICREIPAEGRTRLSFINMAQWDFEPTPNQEWAVFNRIPRRECVLFSGIGGSGKSITQLTLSVASVLARDWLGVVPEQGPAIFIDAEDDEKVLHRRIKAIAEHYDASVTEMINDGLRLVSWRGCDAALAVAARNGKIEPTSLYRELLEVAGDIKPIMIGIAASANVFAGNENDRAQVQQFISLLTRVAMAANGSIVLISHPSVAGINTESGLSGSTQWHNSVRARYFMREVKPEAGEPLDTDLRELVFKKNNYGSISESIMLRWSNGLFLPESGEVLDRTVKEAAAEEIFLTLLKRFGTTNRNVSDKPSVNYAPALFAVEDEAKRAGLAKRDLEHAMRRLFQRNAIWNEPHGRPSRPSYHIALKP